MREEKDRLRRWQDYRYAAFIQCERWGRSRGSVLRIGTSNLEVKGGIRGTSVDCHLQGFETRDAMRDKS